MDGRKFDDLAKAMVGNKNRRGFLKAFAAGAALVVGGKVTEQAASAATCSNAGQTCNSTTPCCTGNTCVGTTCCASKNVCGTKCCTPPANSTATCTNGVCGFTCNAGYSLYNGTCIACASGFNCKGVCCTVPANATGACGPKCTFTCNAGFKLCNGACIPTSQCCSTADCAIAANASATCTAGVCSYTCNAGYANCDGNWANGCESILTSNNSCGACGVVCPVGQNCCNGTCKDVQTDEGNCGACGNVCNPGQICCGGVCKNGNCCSATDCPSLPNASKICSANTCIYTCNTGFDNCNGNITSDGCEVNLLSSNANCGACGVTCPVGTSCCGGVCKSLQTDENNCGACGFTCGANQICCGGVCKNGNCCTSGDCPAEANAIAACTANTCSYSCAAGFGNCNGDMAADGCEVDFSSNNDHCGACGNACAAGESCCGGVCKAIQTDENNCGACGNVCGAGQICCGGVCKNGDCCSGADCPTYAHSSVACISNVCGYTCDANWGNCDGDIASGGCEADLLSDENNCGACGDVCGAGQTCCGGVCKSLQTDENNCGACGNVCGAGEICCGGACYAGDCCSTADCATYDNSIVSCADHVCGYACDAGWGNCDGDIASGGCETDLLTSNDHCGACDDACPSGKDCCGGSCKDLQSDENHCGACGNVCDEGEICCGGACYAGDCCADADCPAVANADVICQNHSCSYTCDLLWGNCDGSFPLGGCETDLDSVENCGACGNDCGDSTPLGATAVCDFGACDFTCPSGTKKCLGSCIDEYACCFDTDCSDENYCDRDAGTCTCRYRVCDGACCPGPDFACSNGGNSGFCVMSPSRTR